MEKQKERKTFLNSAFLSIILGSSALLSLLIFLFTPISLIIGFFIIRIFEFLNINLVIFGGDEGAWTSAFFFSLFIPFILSFLGLILGTIGLRSRKEEAKIGMVISSIPFLIIGLLIIIRVILKIYT